MDEYEEIVLFELETMIDGLKAYESANWKHMPAWVWAHLHTLILQSDHLLAAIKMRREGYRLQKVHLSEEATSEAGEDNLS